MTNVLSVVLGFAMGMIFKKISEKMIIKRQRDVKGMRFFSGKYAIFCWGIITGLGFVLIQNIFSDNIIHIIEACLLFTICLSISAIDISIKKIPNELIGVILIIKIIMIIILKQNIVNNLFGMMIAYFVYIFPSKYGRSIGWGDIKLAVIVGFYLGVYGFIVTTAIMGISIAVYWVYLKITKKGNKDTVLAVGPYICFGFMLTLFINKF